MASSPRARRRASRAFVTPGVNDGLSTLEGSGKRRGKPRVHRVLREVAAVRQELRHLRDVVRQR